MDPTEIITKLDELLQIHLKEHRKNGFVRFKNPEELQAVLDLENDEGRGDWSQVFNWIEKYLKYSVRTNHPGFLNRMWEGANLPSILGEMVVAITNTSSCTYESAPVSTLMEKYMLVEMLELVGFVSGEGQMTTGSSNANMLAMMAARNECLDRVKEDGLFGQKELFAFVSADAHYSLEKAANILGIGTSHLIKIPVNEQGEMNVAILEERLLEIQEKGGIPFFVAGTSGTTVRGAYDPIEDLLELRQKHPFWLHIDAAWGGAVLVSDLLRKQYMSGIEKVDSLTWDFHKMLGTALMCNVFLINNRVHTLGKVCSGGDDSYLFHGRNSNTVYNLGEVSLQCGRRVDSLKWFLDWKFYGRKGFAERVELSLELCRYAEQVVQSYKELELVFPRNSFNICFRFLGEVKMGDDLNLVLRERLYHEGNSLVGCAFHENRPFLRLLLTNHELTKTDVDHYFRELVERGKQLEEELK